MDKQALIKSIHEAFKEVAAPDDSEILLEGWDTYYKLDQAKKEFAVDHWNKLSFSTVREHQELLAGLKPEWFYYLLPAFLVRTLENLPEADILWNTTHYNLTHPVLLRDFRKESEKHFHAKVSLFDSDQCYMMGQYLRYFVTLDPDTAIYDDNNIRSAIQLWDQKRKEKEAIEATQTE